MCGNDTVGNQEGATECELPISQTHERTGKQYMSDSLGSLTECEETTVEKNFEKYTDKETRE